MSAILELLQKASGHTDDKISVIIPAYNREKYIGTCIESVLSQTIPLSMLEIIVVDDASTDGTKNIIKTLENKFPDNIMLVECTENSKGFIGKVRNIGLNYASGRYISFLDSDDSVESNFFEKLYMKAVLYSADFVGGGYRVVSDGRVLGTFSKVEKFYESEKVTEKKLLLMEEGISGYVWGKLYNKDFLVGNNIFFPEDRHLSEDSFFHAKALRYAKRVYNMSDSLYNYTLNDAGVWNSDKANSYIMECFETQVELQGILSELGEEYRQELEWMFYEAVYGMRNKCIENSQKDTFEQFLSYIKEKAKCLYPNLEKNNYIYQEKSKSNLELLEEMFDEEISFDKKRSVYILAPEGGKSGGPELLHQFCNTLNNYGVDAKMVYFSGDGSFVDRFCPDAYIKYETKSESDIAVIDSSNSIVIIPEEAVIFCKLFKKVKPVVWWLSVDNYLESYFVVENLKSGGDIDPIGFSHSNKFLHMVQSKYAYSFLITQLNISPEEIVYLSDYINDSFFANNEIKKENVVMYNPKKGYEDLKHIIKKAPDIKFMPIQNMTAEQVYENLCKAKVYIDLGKFPGKDRIPREAAMAGCCVITNKKGAAAYSGDVPIPETFKFENPLESIDEILGLIRDIFENYEKYSEDFDGYRNVICEEKSWFLRDVRHFITVV